MIPTGLNFCPVCGCNIKAISLSLAFTAPGFVEPPAPPEPKLAPKPVSRKPIPAFYARGSMKSEEIAAIVAEGKAAGKSMTQIALETGMGNSTLWYHLDKVNKAKGLKPRPRTDQPLPPGSITQEQKEDMHRRHSAGESANMIARSMGLKVGTVGAIIYKKPKLNGVEVGS
jgi:hypothetical protein